MSESPAFADDARRLAEREFLGLHIDDSGLRGNLHVTDRLVNPRGSFYGGAGVGLAVAAMEAATGRRALWTTLQFLSTPMLGARVDFETEVRQHGRRSSQVRVTTFFDGNEAFTAVGATGVARSDLSVTFDRMPAVAPPEDCPVEEFAHLGDISTSRFAAMEHRIAASPEALAGSATQVALWARVDGMTSTPTILGFIGDCSAIALFQALGEPDARGTSLDNTLRVGPPVETEWILLDLRGHFVSEGYGNATANMWSPDGTLLGSMCQTLTMRMP